jgi:hypothetical protein
MTEPNDPLAGLPDIVRSSNRPIIIYQGPPPQSYVDARTNSALGSLAWLVLITTCLAIAAASAWSLWNPGFDAHRFSPIYAEGRPLGLSGQIEERRQINAWADGLTEFRDELRANNDARRVIALSQPLITDHQGIDLDHQGIDELRQRWDAMCQSIRASIYDRRFDAVDARMALLRQQRLRAGTASDLQSIDSVLQALKQQRDELVERERTDSDPQLRCTPTAQADVCSDSNNDAWCNPQLRHPEEFADDE